ncbi:hypothetical protein ABZY16_31325 [Streptomyces sp. NPDC006553]|nr:hypothetical protein [Streptomyces sp. NBC_00233]MCX5226336.1 hypothetical protein [Streptomyces sp. NBC_00233]
MPEWLWAALIPGGMIGLGAVGFLVWAKLGTDRPVEHHGVEQKEWDPGG